MHRGTAFVFVVWATSLLAGATRADEPVYRYRNAEGREVFTNAANRLERTGERPTELALPALASMDFEMATALQLQSLDRGVERAHEALQSGARCEAIRASSRVPMRTFFWREHLRELLVVGVLLAVALVVLVVWNGRLRGLMPLPSLLGALYLGYVTYADVDQQMTALRDGLRACSSELPDRQSTNPSSVKQRLESALSVQAMIDRAYSERAAQAELALQER